MDNHKRLNKLISSKDNFANKKVTKIIIHFEDGSKEMIRKGMHVHINSAIGFFKAHLVGSYCRIIKKYNKDLEAA